MSSMTRQKFTAAQVDAVRGAAMRMFHSADQDARDALLDFFNSMDTDGSGSVDRTEFRDFLTGMLQHQHEQGCDPAYIRRVVDGFDKVWDLVDLNGDGTLDFFEAGALMLVMQLAVCDSCDQPIVDTHIWACSTCFGELAAATLGCPEQQQLQQQQGGGSGGQVGGGDGKVILLCRGCRFRGAERDGVPGGSMGRNATDCVCSEGHPMRPAQVEMGVPIRETTWWKNIVKKQQQRMQGLASSGSSLQRSPGLEAVGSRPAPASWRSDSLGSTNGAAPEPAGAAATVTCLCCSAQHNVVPPYISHGHDRHVLALPDGSGYVCELCSTWICERCGKMEYADGKSGSPGMWLAPGCTHSQKCRKAGGGGWSIQRGPVVARAEDTTRAHCATCRPGLLALRQVEQRRGGPLQERKGQQLQQVGGQQGAGEKGKPAAKGKGFGAAVERQAAGVTNKLADAGCVVM